jgi:hypothetical protein
LRYQQWFRRLSPEWSKSLRVSDQFRRQIAETQSVIVRVSAVFAEVNVVGEKEVSCVTTGV